MIRVSYDQLSDLFPNGRDDIIHAAANEADDVLGRFDINTKSDRLIFFLAQVGHESAGFTRLEEGFYYKDAERIFRFYKGKGRFKTVADAAPYVRNPDLLRQRLYGDYPNYYGRGLIQLTTRDNYEKVGAIVGLPLAADPDLAARPEHALLIACGYWQSRNLNECADSNDYDRASALINPGEPNPAVRRTYLQAARRIFGGGAAADTTSQSHTNASDAATGDFVMIAFGQSGMPVESLQRSLEKLGYPVGKTDGKFGRLTRAAVAAFQLDNDLPGTGSVDAETWATLSTAGPRQLDSERTQATASDVRKEGSRTVANANIVQISGIATAILGALGVAEGTVGGGVVAAAPDSTLPVAAAVPDLAAATGQLQTALQAINPTGVAAQFQDSFNQAGPQVFKALESWATAVSAAGHAAAGTVAPIQNSGGGIDFGALTPIVNTLVPQGAVGSAILAALGIGVHLFGSRIVQARVSDFKTGRNLGR